MKRRLIIFGFTLLAVIAAAFALNQQSLLPQQNSATNQLQAPQFVSAARAEEDAAGSYLENEAGFSAYFQDPAGINLSGIRGLFKTIEQETSQYIIGSVAIPNYNENEDVHIYANVNGWVMAYYDKTQPIAKAVDMHSYRTNGSLNTTKLQNALSLIAATTGSPLTNLAYYDFRYPNATHFMLVGEKDEGGENSFKITLPSSYGYSERGFILGSGNGYYSSFYLDGVELARSSSYSYGVIPASQLTPDVEHTISVQYNNAHGILILLYRVP